MSFTQPFEKDFRAKVNECTVSYELTLTNFSSVQDTSSLMEEPQYGFQRPPDLESQHSIEPHEASQVSSAHLSQMDDIQKSMYMD